MYADVGWAGWGDWFGTGSVAFSSRKYRSFAKARAFARLLLLKSGKEWFDYCKSGQKPADIPSKPDRYDQWAGMDDWLGIQNRSFKEARVFVRNLNLKSGKEWRAYCKQEQRPDDIPKTPRQVYANEGWAGMSDWLGTGRVAPGNHRPFKLAYAFVRSLRLNSYDEWQAYKKAGKLPSDIPKAPHQVYAKTWDGYAAWLGTGRLAPGSHRPFVNARAFVHGLNLKSATEWRTYCNSGKKPPDIPSNPHKTFAEAGWKSWGDWLGTGRISDALRSHRDFAEARAFARALRLESEADWRNYCRSGNMPHDIPKSPWQVYVKDGWAGMSDWLGAGRARVIRRRQFKEARAYVRQLNLKSASEWRAFSQSEKRPADIPVVPDKTYADAGWAGWADWLGTSRVSQV